MIMHCFSLKQQQNEATARRIRVLLYYPPLPSSFWGFNYSMQDLMGGRKTVCPPLALLTVAGALPRHWDVKLIDGNLDPVKDADIEDCDVAMISAWDVQVSAAADFAARVRKFKRILVAGGVGPTMRPQEFPLAHYIFRGELDETFGELISALEKDLLPPEKQIIFQARGRLPLSEQPLARFDLIKFSRYIYIPLQASAGCPFDCEFCEIPKLLGKPQRYKQAERIIKELDNIYALGYRGSVFLVDDNFLGAPKQARQILSAMIDWQAKHNSPFTFLTEASINMAEDVGLIQAMRKAGFTSVFIGIESPDEHSLKEAGKRQNLHRDPAEAIKRISEGGIQVMGAFIVGFDSERPGAGRRIAELAERAGILVVSPNLLGAPEGSPLRERLAAAGRLLQEQPLVDGITPRTNVSYLRGYESVVADWRDIWRLAYDPNQLFPRIRRVLAAIPGRNSGRRLGVLGNIQFIGRLVWFMGIRAGYRGLFWRLIFWGMRTGKFERTVDECFLAYHFISLRKRILAAE